MPLDFPGFANNQAIDLASKTVTILNTPQGGLTPVAAALLWAEIDVFNTRANLFAR